MKIAQAISSQSEIRHIFTLMQPHLEHDPEEHAPHVMQGGNRFAIATNAERVCAEIMLEQIAPPRGADGQ